MAMLVQNNTPSAGYIKWTGVSIAYKGKTYKIADGSTNFVYIYWKYSDPLSFYGSNVFPTLGDDDLLVFLNKQGTHVKVPTATVVDGSLIVPESILTDALAANSISSEKIQTDAITARQVKAGSLTSDLLATGVNPNIVRDGYDTLSQLPTGTGNVTKGTAKTFTILDYANGLTGSRVLQAIGGNGYLAKTLTDFTIPVVPGQKLVVSAYVRSDITGSNNQSIGLRFNNTALDVLGATIAVQGNTGWQRLATIVTVPAGATKAMLYLSSLGTYYWDAFMVELVTDTQTQASTWKPAGTTVIWGGNIATKSIDVDRLNATSLSAISANLGTVTAGTINGVNITGTVFENKVGSDYTKLYIDGIPIFDNVRVASGTTYTARIASGNVYLSQENAFTLICDNTITPSDITLKGSGPTPNTAKLNIPDGLGFHYYDGIKTYDTVFGYDGVTSSQPFKISNTVTTPSLELRNVGTRPYIDFSNDATSDYDARIILDGDDILSIIGADTKFGLRTNQNMYLEGGLGATIFRGDGTRLVFHDGNATLRVESASGGSANLVVATVNGSSDRELKKNIVDYDKSALNEINTTPIRYYQFKDEVDNVDMPHVGIIMQEAPIDVVDPRGNGVDLYAMIAMSWKAIQELSNRITDLENRMVS